MREIQNPVQLAVRVDVLVVDRAVHYGLIKALHILRNVQHLNTDDLVQVASGGSIVSCDSFDFADSHGFCLLLGIKIPPKL